MDVFHPNDTFNFDKLQLTHPNSIAGGTYLTRYSYCESKQPLYIQTTKTNSKQGIVISGKKAHIDLLLTTSDADSEFTEWFANLEKRSVDLLYEKRHLWFTQELDRTDIENSFTSPIRAYKTGNFLIRVNLEPNRNFTHIQPFSCKIFEENKQSVSVDYIKAEHSIISILEFQGIRFTSRNFQIELLLRQVLVVPDVPLFETCVIKESFPERMPEQEPEQEQELDMPECLGTAPTQDQDQDQTQDQDQDQDQTQDQTQDPYATERNITTMKHFEFTEVDIDFKNIPDTIDTSLPEFKMDPEITNTATATATAATGNTIKLKKHKDVLYEMYKVAKHKAQEAKKAAIRAYLEAKEIKAAYLLDDDSEYSDDSDDDRK